MGLEMKYFVLSPTKKNEFGAASRAALLAYADRIQETNWQLANDLRDWVKKVRQEIGEAVDEGKMRKTEERREFQTRDETPRIQRRRPFEL